MAHPISTRYGNNHPQPDWLIKYGCMLIASSITLETFDDLPGSHRIDCQSILPQFMAIAVTNDSIRHRHSSVYTDIHTLLAVVVKRHHPATQLLCCHNR